MIPRFIIEAMRKHDLHHTANLTQLGFLREVPMPDHFRKWDVMDGDQINAVLHWFLAPDFSDPHDHPWPFRSHILAGGYMEQFYDPRTGSSSYRDHAPGSVVDITAEHIHRIIDLPEGDCWTVIYPGAPSLRWGTWRWINGVPHKRFLNEGEFQPVEV